MGKIKKLIEAGKTHLVDSTAMLAIGTSVSAAMEVGIAGMSDDVSINARLLAAGLTYAGMGSVFSRGRDLWRMGFGITDKTREKIQGIHDIAYMTALNSAISPIFYYISGSRDWKEIVIGTAGIAALNLSLGWPAGYTIDLFRDLTGIKKSERIPSRIRNLGSGTKKGLATLALAGSLAVTAGIYGLTQDKNETYQPQPVIEQLQEDYQPKNLEQITVQ